MCTDGLDSTPPDLSPKVPFPCTTRSVIPWRPFYVEGIIIIRKLNQITRDNIKHYIMRTSAYLPLPPVISFPFQHKRNVTQDLFVRFSCNLDKSETHRILVVIFNETVEESRIACLCCDIPLTSHNLRYFFWLLVVHRCFIPLVTLLPW